VWESVSGDEFGHSVSVSGEMAVVGAYGTDDAGDYSGSAYVFKSPEPATLLLFAAAAAGIGMMRQRLRRC